MNPKPCPNCGSTKIWKIHSWTNRLFKYSLECSECHWCSTQAITKAGALLKWQAQKEVKHDDD